MLRLIKKYFITIIFLVIGFTVGIVSYNFSYEKILGYLNSGYISNESIEFNLKKIEESKEKLRFKDIESNINIYEKNNKYINRVYFKGRGFELPIYKGSFFSDVDFINKEKIVIVGKNVKIDKVENGNDYIKLGNDYYKVIGYTGIQDKSILDEMVYLPIHEDEYIEEGKFVIEGKNTSKDYINLEKELKDIYELKRFNKDESYTNRLFKNPDINKTSDLAIWIIFVLSILSYSYYIVQHNKNKIKVLKICGLSDYNIFKYCFKNMIILSVFNYIIGVFISVIFISYISEPYILKEYIFSLGKLLIKGIIVYIIPMILLSNFFIKKELIGKRV